MSQQFLAQWAYRAHSEPTGLVVPNRSLNHGRGGRRALSNDAGGSTAFIGWLEGTCFLQLTYPRPKPLGSMGHGDPGASIYG